MHILFQHVLAKICFFQLISQIKKAHMPKNGHKKVHLCFLCCPRLL